MTIRPSFWHLIILAVTCLVVTFVALRKQGREGEENQLSQPLPTPYQQSFQSLSFKKQNTVDGDVDGSRNNNMMKAAGGGGGGSRNMVGGFSTLPLEELKSEEVLTVANFAINQLITTSASKTTEDAEVTSEIPGGPPRAVIPDSYQPLLLAVKEANSAKSLEEEEEKEGESDSIRVVVLDAQRQVVAGLNYKLTLALLINNQCLGGIKGATIYNHFGDLSIISWGKSIGCEEVDSLAKDLGFGSLESLLLTEEGEEGNLEEGVLRQEEESEGIVEREEEKALILEEEVKEELEEEEPDE